MYGSRRSYPEERVSLASSQLHHTLQRSASLYPRRLSALNLFDRAARASWWNPRFDSKVLEEQFRQSSFPQTEQHFRYALCYILLSALVYGAHSCANYKDNTNWPYVVACSLMLSLVALSFLLFTLIRPLDYKHHAWKLAVATLLSMTGFTLAMFVLTLGTDEHSLAVGSFSTCLMVLMLSYTLIGPLPLYAICIFCILYSTLFEIISSQKLRDVNSGVTLAVRLILHISIHLLGVQIRLLAEISMRNTFYKVGESLLVRRELEIEKQLKEKMIHSVMPPSVATWLMTNTAEDEPEVADMQPRASNANNQMSFRPFNMHRMENVSILFADIVGFTKMSSNKSASQLVGLLNDLFGRFDFLCQKNGCEKISTLGDCYYCVAGCPEPKPDHAKCCVEMGLSMIKAIAEFDEDTNENVNMRVGVHTGTVLCGIVGTKRFKFDVWSNDVKYANRMESMGRPGRVHISEATHAFLVDQYHMEEASMDGDKKTFFIRGRKLAGSRHSWPRFSAPTLAHIGHQYSTDSTCSNSTAVQATAENVNHALSTRKASCPPLSEEKMGESGEEEEWLCREEEVVVVQPMVQPMVYYAPRRHSSLSTLYSRKDSGIVTARSSFQLESAVECSIDRHGRTSTSTGRSSGVSSMRGYSLFGDDSGALGIRLHLRKQSDLQMIRCIQQDCADAELFVHPPVHNFSLFFTDDQIERGYRDRLLERELAPTLASPTFTVYMCMVVALVFYFISLITCFMLFDAPISFLLFCFGASFVHIATAMICLREILATRGNWQTNDCFTAAFRYLMKWRPLHIIGMVLLWLPMASVFSNFSCGRVMSKPATTDGFCFLSFAFLLHFTNFSQVNFWLRSFLATIAGIGLVLFIGGPWCPCDPNSLCHCQGSHGAPSNSSSKLYHQDSFSCRNTDITSNLLVHVLLTVILVWLLNREFEMSLRLSFHGGWLAAQDQKRMQVLKRQADWLLHNIIPRHVVEQLKNTSRYSENHRDAGILFASIVNFHELYDESYEGGRECLRVLNELVGDFDELLSKPQFRNVTKIKTIGSTFMAASGLNPKFRRENPHPFMHLFELMDFALAMQRVIEDFNSNLLEFKFVLRVGYAHGDITAGVIGTTKLYYDIWGDAVNTASRMDSYGVTGRIQVPEQCLSVLEEMYTFEPRGSMYIKGKDQMNVYLLSKKKDKQLHKIPLKRQATNTSQL